MIFQSPAKVNLFLRVLGRRNDGYHELASLFQAVSLCDTLHIQLSDRDVLTCTVAQVPIDENNLVCKALELFRRKTGLSVHLNVHLEKKIPIEAGLGGGSGNAATTLWALRELTQCPCTTHELAAWAAEIGSDVAFFLSQGTAYCTGRGEQILNLNPLARQQLHIVKPHQGLSTPRVYQTLKLNSLQQRDPESSLSSHLYGIPDYYNDLEEAAFQLMPSLKEWKNALLEQGYQKVLLCGSGTSLFCLGEGNPVALPGMAAFSAHFINRAAEQWYGQATDQQRP